MRRSSFLKSLLGIAVSPIAASKLLAEEKKQSVFKQKWETKEGLPDIKEPPIRLRDIIKFKDGKNYMVTNINNVNSEVIIEARPIASGGGAYLIQFKQSDKNYVRMCSALQY